MRYIPHPKPDPKGKRPVRNLGHVDLVKEHLVAINAGVCALVTLLAYVTDYGSRAGYAGVPWALGLVPGGGLSSVSLPHSLAFFSCYSVCQLGYWSDVVLIPDYSRLRDRLHCAKIDAFCGRGTAGKSQV